MFLALSWGETFTVYSVCTLNPFAGIVAFENLLHSEKGCPNGHVSSVEGDICMGYCMRINYLFASIVARNKL